MPAVPALPVTPPLAARRPERQTWHGIEVVDDYAWLRAENWQEVMRDPARLDPAIRAHLEAENAHTEAALAGTKALRDTLFAEMKARLKPDDAMVPAPDGPFEYYATFVTGRQYPRLCRIPRGGGAVEILLDGNVEAEGKAFWDLGAHAHSPDHRLLAYATDDKGSELATIRIRDLATGRNLTDEIPETRGDIAWSTDSRTIFYVRLDAELRPLRVFRHEIGTPASADALVYEERDTGFYVHVGKTQSAAFIVIESRDHQTSEVRLVDARAAHEPPRLVARRVTGHEYMVEHDGGERLVITTNSAGAEDFRICTAPLPGNRQPATGNRDVSMAGDPDAGCRLPAADWPELIPHRPGRLIIDTVCYKRHLVRLEREDGLPRIVIRRLSDGAEHAIAFAEEAYGLGLFSGHEFDTPNLRFTYSSMTTPAETFDYDMESRTRTLRKRQEIPSGHDPSRYVTRRLLAPAADGETVPVSLLYRSDTPLDGSAPVFLYGYGAYGISIPAAFSAHRLSLVDRGFIFAIAHVRGGKDKGYRWYRMGRGAQKTNTFTDFIAAGEHLAALGLTRRGRIVANGGSAGGMLMGAVANMAPDLFLGLVADVPFVDVLNTMLDKDLPLTPPEWPEWGNPIASKAEFETIRSYSPYDNVGPKPYPHILALAGLTDPRVTYWEPAKWVAKLRRETASSNLVLLKTNMEAGHGGASGRFEQLKEIALDYAFALMIAGKA